MIRPLSLRLRTDTYDEIACDRNSKHNPVEAKNLEERQPSIRLTRMTYRRDLYNGCDHSDAKVDPVAFTPVKSTPADSKSQQYFQ